jgi:hypothetical protein
MVAALVKARLVDLVEDQTVRLCVHDWAEHCEDAVHMKLARLRGRFANGEFPKLVRLPKEEREEAERDYVSLYGREYREKAHGVRMKAHGIRTEAHGVRMKAHDPCALKRTASASASASEEREREGEVGAREAVGDPEGDEGYRALKDRPELSELTWEQDLTARRDGGWGLENPPPGEVIEAVVDRAILAGRIDQVGSWLRAQYAKLRSEMEGEKKEKQGGGDGLEEWARLRKLAVMAGTGTTREGYSR